MGDDPGDMRAECLKLQCALQDRQATCDAYMSKLKEKSADVKTRDRTIAERDQQIVDLETEVLKGKERERQLEALLQSYNDEREEARDDARDMSAGENEAVLLELDRKKEDILHLKETIANMQARDALAAAEADESDAMAQLHKENHRLVELVMELKKREAEAINDKNETDRGRDRDKAKTPKRTFSPKKKAQDGLGVWPSLTSLFS